MNILDDGTSMFNGALRSVSLFYAWRKYNEGAITLETSEGSTGHIRKYKHHDQSEVKSITSPSSSAFLFTPATAGPVWVPLAVA